MLRFKATNLLSVLFAIFCLMPLRAQLDSRLVTTQDTLDLYKNPTVVKPEIITLIDMSGSMCALTWHPNYGPSLSLQDDSSTRSQIGANDATVTLTTGFVTLKTSGGSTAWSLKRTVGATTTYTNITLKLTIPIVGNRNYGTAGSYIMPDGTPVETWLLSHPEEFYDSTTQTLKIDNSTDTSPIRSNGTPSFTNNATLTLSPNHRYFAKKATHARMTYLSKTIDIPIPWTIFDSPASVATTATNYCTSDAEDPQSTASPKDRVKFDTYDARPAVAGGSGAAGYFPTNANYGVAYNNEYFIWIFTGSNIASSTGTGAVTAWANGLPVLTRLQANKKAVISTWLSVQTKVYWAVRALDDSNDKATLNSAPTGTDRWVPRLLTDRTSSGLAWIQGEYPDGTTPLTLALAGSYAQMVDGSVFTASRGATYNSVEQKVNACRKQFVIVFTDGVANDGWKTGDPFKSATATTATAAISTLQTTPANLNSSNTYFNMWTLAGLAAHGNDSGWAATRTSGTGSISSFAPFRIVKDKNGSANYATPHYIETMTIGVSLSGDPLVSGSPKNALLLTAGYGKADQSNYNSANYVASNSTSTTGYKVRFWDAQNATSLNASLLAALDAVMDAPPTGTSPVAPMAGLTAGDQVYFARYKAEAGTVPFWGGDLMMVRNQVSGSDIIVRGLNGVDLTNQPITDENAIWAASKVLASTTWSTRKVYTYFDKKTSTDSTANRYASMSVDLTDSAYRFSTANTNLLKFMTEVASPDSTLQNAQKPKIEWMLGKNRTDGSGLLGDIINSTPVVIEYGLGVSNYNLTQAGLGAAIGKSGVRLRVIFVGTNHGMFHAFAEASYYDGTPSVLTAIATELWAFVPPEFAIGRTYDQLIGGTAHVYMVDGAAAGYLDESQSTAGYMGKVDNSNDKALVVFGLGKGGRSKYALDVSNPFAPKLAWMLRPDDEIGTDANPTIAGMGMSTGRPELAQILTTTLPGPLLGTKDVLFIGGGLSTDAVDAKFGAGVKLGRSVFAVETQTGALYKTWDFINNTDLQSRFPSMGSVPAGVVPIEVLVGSNMAQRVYFADRSGGVYALGSGKLQTVTATNPGFRIDSSDPKQWVDDSNNLSVRKLFQANAGEYITTSPVPFNLPYAYPGKAITGKNPPRAVGVAVGTGDLWDPMDLDATNPAQITPNEYHRLVMLFDRNDSSAMGYDTSGITLTDLTTPGFNIVPTSPSYYLKSSDGYFLGFKRKVKPDVVGYFYSKIISEPLVFRSVLYFTLLNPDLDLSGANCSGISKSIVYRVANVINPSWVTSQVSGTASGALFTFAGVPGRLSVLGPNMVGTVGTMLIRKDGTPVNAGVGNFEPGTDYVPLPGPPVNMRNWRIVR